MYIHKEPSHATLATLGICREDAVLADPFGITDFQQCWVNEADPSTHSIARLQIGKQRKHHHRDECNFHASFPFLYLSEQRKMEALIADTNHGISFL